MLIKAHEPLVAVDDRHDLPEFLTARVDDVLSFVGVSK